VICVLPAQAKGIDFLRERTDLRVLVAGSSIYKATQTPAKFWRKWDAAKEGHGHE